MKQCVFFRFFCQAAKGKATVLQDLAGDPIRLLPMEVHEIGVETLVMGHTNLLKDRMRIDHSTEMKEEKEQMEKVFQFAQRVDAENQGLPEWQNKTWDWNQAVRMMVRTRTGRQLLSVMADAFEGTSVRIAATTDGFPYKDAVGMISEDENGAVITPRPGLSLERMILALAHDADHYLERLKWVRDWAEKERIHPGNADPKMDWIDLSRAYDSQLYNQNLLNHEVAAYGAGARLFLDMLALNPKFDSGQPDVNSDRTILTAIRNNNLCPTVQERLTKPDKDGKTPSGDWLDPQKVICTDHP